MRIPHLDSHKSALASQVHGRERAAPLSLMRSDTAPRYLFVDDIYQLLRGAKSKWWIRTQFAPHLRLKIGRTLAWLESDVHAWIETLRAPR